jgi:hypothetical protein
MSVYIKYFKTFGSASSFRLCIYAIWLLRNTIGVYHAQFDRITWSITCSSSRMHWRHFRASALVYHSCRILHLCLTLSQYSERGQQFLPVFQGVLTLFDVRQRCAEGGVCKMWEIAITTGNSGKVRHFLGMLGVLWRWWYITSLWLCVVPKVYHGTYFNSFEATVSTVLKGKCRWGDGGGWEGSNKMYINKVRFEEYLPQNKPC